RRIGLQRRYDDNHVGARAGLGIGDHFANAASDNEPHLRFTPRIRRLNPPLHFAAKFFASPWQREKRAAGGIFEPIEMPVEEKKLSLVGAERIVNAVAEEKTMIEDRNGRVVRGGDRAVDIYAGLH